MMGQVQSEEVAQQQAVEKKSPGLETNSQPSISPPVDEQTEIRAIPPTATLTPAAPQPDVNLSNAAAGTQQNANMYRRSLIQKVLGVAGFTLAEFDDAHSKGLRQVNK